MNAPMTRRIRRPAAAEIRPDLPLSRAGGRDSLGASLGTVAVRMRALWGRQRRCWGSRGYRLCRLHRPGGCIDSRAVSRSLVGGRAQAHPAV